MGRKEEIGLLEGNVVRTRGTLQTMSGRLEQLKALEQEATALPSLIEQQEEYIKQLGERYKSTKELNILEEGRREIKRYIRCIERFCEISETPRAIVLKFDIAIRNMASTPYSIDLLQLKARWNYIILGVLVTR